MEFGIRLNAAYRGGDTAIDKQDERDKVLSLGLDYRGERLRASLDMLYEAEDRPRGAPVPVRPVAGPSARRAGRQPQLSRLRGALETTDKMIVGRVEYDLTDRITAHAGVGTRHHDMDALAGNITLLNTAGDFTSTPVLAAVRGERRVLRGGGGFPLRHRAGRPQAGGELLPRRREAGHLLRLQHLRAAPVQPLQPDARRHARRGRHFGAFRQLQRHHADQLRAGRHAVHVR